MRQPGWGWWDLAFQAVDGTRVGASASRDRTLDEAGLRRLLARVEVELDALEARNSTENEPPSPRLPEELTDKRAPCKGGSGMRLWR